MEQLYSTERRNDQTGLKHHDEMKFSVHCCTIIELYIYAHACMKIYDSYNPWREGGQTLARHPTPTTHDADTAEHLNIILFKCSQ